MSNIDFSRLIPRKAVLVQSIEAHKQATKAECKRRILERVSFSTQQNIVRAALLASPDPHNDARGDKPHLDHADKQLLARLDEWIAQMQDSCRTLSGMLDTDIHADNTWPEFPAEVASLTARF